MIKVSRTNTAFRLKMDEPPAWAKYGVGITLGYVERRSDGTIMLKFVHTPPEVEERFRVTGSSLPDGSYLFQWQARSVMDQMDERFGLTEAEVLSLSDEHIELLLPADRKPMLRLPKEVKPKPTAVATIRETITSMSKESPPPDFTPAIPLREAVDTINAYKLHEGDAMELTLSKRGRLKVKYEYGG